MSTPFYQTGTNFGHPLPSSKSLPAAHPLAAAAAADYAGSAAAMELAPATPLIGAGGYYQGPAAAAAVMAPPLEPHNYPPHQRKHILWAESTFTPTVHGTEPEHFLDEPESYAGVLE